MNYLLFAALLLTISAPAFACGDHETGTEHAAHAMGHDSHDMNGMKMSAAPSTAAYQKAMTSMHKNMMIEYTSNADADFARGMIPHHQGAVDMAKIELQYGKDPELRKLAEEVIKAQNTEIKFMKAWLARH